MPELEFATIEEIFEEIANRYPRSIIILEDKAKGDDNRYEVSYSITGGLSIGLGLIHRLRLIIEGQIEDCNNDEKT